MAEERNFLTPLNEAGDLLRECKDELAMFAHALHVVGNSELADKLAAVSADLSKAVRLTEEGRDWALKVHLYGAEQATKNMVETALAVGRGVQVMGPLG